MRFIVFFLGVAGSLLAGVAGWFWFDYTFSRAVEPTLRDTSNLLVVVLPDYDAHFATTMWAALFLMAGAGLGLLGSLLTLLRRGRHGAVLMLLAVFGPALLNPVTLAFTGLLAFAGLLSFFVRPLNPVAVTAD